LLISSQPARAPDMTGVHPMSDPADNQGLFGIHGAALELRSQRMGLIASNIANAATPGFKARDIDFAAALAARTKGAGLDQAAAAATVYRVPVMPALDGNTVELGTEQVAFSQNAVGYSATLSFLSGRVGTITRAIKGE
jgi:flagellar basal-body rod protein FlgB